MHRASGGTKAAKRAKTPHRAGPLRAARVITAWTRNVYVELGGGGGNKRDIPTIGVKEKLRGVVRVSEGWRVCVVL